MSTHANGTSRAFTVTLNEGEYFLWLGKSEDGQLLEVSTDMNVIAAEMVRYNSLEVLGSGRNIFGHVLPALGY